MFTIKEGVFFNVTKNRATGVSAKQTKAGRWQYRDVDTNKLIASGVSPEAFVKKFWFGEYSEAI